LAINHKNGFLEYSSDREVLKKDKAWGCKKIRFIDYFSISIGLRGSNKRLMKFETVLHHEEVNLQKHNAVQFQKIGAPMTASGPS
jgi:hypothetical protein